MLLNIHFQKYLYNFEIYTYIIVNGTGTEIKHKHLQLTYCNKQVSNFCLIHVDWFLITTQHCPV